MNKRNTFVAVSATAIMMATGAWASLIAVQLTGDAWATATGNLGNSNTLMTESTIQPASGYSGPDFRGGSIATDTTIGNWEVLDNGGSNILAGKDVFRLSIISTDDQADPKYHRAVIFFDQSVFDNGLDTVAGGVTLDDTTSLSYSAKRTSGNPSRIGYVIQADGDYYLHQIAYNDDQAGGGQGHTFTLADPTAVAWNAFDPTVSFSDIGAGATPDFTKVTGIGVWFENERAGNSTLGLDFRVGEISFNAIPEPSTMALLGLSLGSLLMLRRRNA